MLMKQSTKSKTALAGATFLGLAILLGTATGALAWAAAGILGLAVLGFSTTLRPPEMAPVRIRCQKKRS